MLKRKAKKIYLAIYISLIPVLLMTCSTGITPSPDPGILRITLQAKPSDTLIVIIRDTVTTTVGDSFMVKVFQGKAFRNDGSFAILYQNTSEYNETDHVYNLFKRENNQYKKYTIFESFLPPGEYQKVQFGLMGLSMLLTKGFAYGGIGIQMVQPPDQSSLIDFMQDFKIEERLTTEIDIQIEPLQSVVRYKDIYYFIPKVAVTNVRGPF